MAKTLDAAGVKRLIQEIKGANKNLNTPILISTENTPESKAQNVKNIADYVEKAKAAGVDITKRFRVPIICNNWTIEGVYTYNNNIVGVQVTDDPLAYCMVVSEDGYYYESTIVVKGDFDENQITSRMLDKGARKPIILTPSTTEVDEETYQKLLSDDVDVVFKTDSRYVPFTYKEVDGSGITMDFSLTEPDASALDTADVIMINTSIRITKSSPHKVTFPYNASSDLDVILQNSGYFTKSTLTPVLQEIDLTGTDADRKAKLDQFETDWKALTGASDLTGARFVGRFVVTEDVVERNITGIMTYCAGDEPTEKNDNCFYGICNGYSFSEQKSQIAVKVSCKDGSLTITPLFSHLEAITIYTDNTPEHMQANLDNIAAYKTNLDTLGIDTTGSFTIPIYKNDDKSPGILVKANGSDSYAGWSNLDNSFYPIVVAADGDYTEALTITTGGSYSSLTTTSKHIIGAINEINANAVHSDKLVPTLEAITIKTGNTPDDKAANVAVIKAYVDNLKALGVDTTKGYMIPIRTSSEDALVGFIIPNMTGTGYVGLGEINNGNGTNLYISNKGNVSMYRLQDKSDDNLTTTTKSIVGAINELNALAKGYSTIFTPIELTTETAQNKTAIDARVAAFTAQGISLTNGCCIPVTYKGVYAGNISLINGDWYGLLVKNTNNPADNINIKLSADGTITEGNSVQ